MSENLLGGKGVVPATFKDKQKFREFCRRFPDLSADELARMQEIEWGLTLSEYNILKFGE